MDNIPISNFFILKNDKLIFIYDFLNYWTFFIELHEVGEFINDDSNYINKYDKKYKNIKNIK